MRDVKVLVLEDDLETVQVILAVLRDVEEKKFSFAVTVLPDYIQTEEFINKNPQIRFDILLLDRDCFLGGTFHVVNLDNFDKEKVISISSVPEYNEKAREMGIKRIVWKDYQNLESFARELKTQITQII